MYIPPIWKYKPVSHCREFVVWTIQNVQNRLKNDPVCSLHKEQLNERDDEMTYCYTQQRDVVVFWA